MKNRLIVFFISLIIASCSNKRDIKNTIFVDFDGNKVDITKGDKLKSFIFLAPECPLSQNYTKQIEELKNEFDLSVDFYQIFSGEIYTDEEVKNFLLDYNVKVNSIKDSTYLISSFFGAKITPEVFLVDKDLDVIYYGKIDDWIESLGVKRQIVTQYYLKEAINQTLKGESVTIKNVEAVGCILE